MRNSIEKIKNNVFTIGKMSFDTTVLNGEKNPNTSVRKDSFWYKKYESEQYANVSQLDQLNINTRNYLVIKYTNFVDDEETGKRKDIGDEIWVNSSNLDNLKEFLLDSYDQISSNANNIYIKGKINPDYEDFIISTGYEDDGSGYGNVDSKHTLYVYPTIGITADGENTYNAVTLAIENNEKETQCGQEMSLRTYYNLVKTIENYDLINDSRLTSIIGLLVQIRDSKETENSSTNFTSATGRTGSGLKPRAIKKPLQKRQNLSEAVKSLKNSTITNVSSIEEDMNDDEDFTQPVVEKTAEKKVVKKKSTNKVALNDILSEAENIQIDLEDEEGEDF